MYQFKTYEEDATFIFASILYQFISGQTTFETTDP